MTGSDIYSQVKANIGNRTDLDTEIYRYINVAQRHLVTTGLSFGHEWTSLEETDTTGTTVDGTRTGSLPSDYASIYDVLLIVSNDSRKLVYENMRSVDKLDPYPEDSAENKPTHYSVFDETLYFRPVPDAAYTYHIRYCQWPADITSGTTTEPISKSSGCLIAYATAYVFASTQDTEMAAFWLGIADGGVSLRPNTTRNKPGGLLGALLGADKYHEDHSSGHREFRSKPAIVAGEPWNDPFVGLVG